MQNILLKMLHLVRYSIRSERVQDDTCNLPEATQTVSCLRYDTAIYFLPSTVVNLINYYRTESSVLIAIYRCSRYRFVKRHSAFNFHQQQCLVYLVDLLDNLLSLPYGKQTHMSEITICEASILITFYISLYVYVYMNLYIL